MVSRENAVSYYTEYQVSTSLVSSIKPYKTYLTLQKLRTCSHSYFSDANKFALCLKTRLSSRKTDEIIQSDVINDFSFGY